MVNIAAILTNAQNLLLQNRWADILETLYVVSGTLAHHNSNDDPIITLTYFTTRSILEDGFYMGKSENNGLVETIAA